jgi:hypothetical protein
MSTTFRQRTTAGLAALLIAGGGHAVIAGPSGMQAAAGSAAATQPSQDAFNRNMQAMRAQMLQLQATKDPAARAKLLEAHLRTMRETMPMMMGQGGMMRGAGGMGPGMMHGGGMSANGQMMQMMMGQMTQHQQAMQAMGCIK